MHQHEPPEQDASARTAVGAQARAHELARRLQELAGAARATDKVHAVEALREALSAELVGALAQPSAAEVAELSDRLARLCATLLAALLSGEEQRAAAAPSAAPARALIIDELEGDSCIVEAPPVPDDAAHDGDIAIRDQRTARRPAPWIGAIARQLRRFEVDHAPFAVLLVALEDVERVRATAEGAERMRLRALLADALRAHARALAEELEPVEQRPGRYWVVVPHADQAAARALATAIARELSAPPVPASWAVRPPRHPREERSEEPLVGVAVCPQHGRTPAALAAHADVDMYASKAVETTGRSAVPAGGAGR